MSKDNAINIMENCNLNEKMDYYKFFLSYVKFFLLYIKMGETTYYQKIREKVLNRAKDY